MQAIGTRFLTGTNKHPNGRIIAKCQAKRKIVPWDSDMGAPENHRRAAMLLAGELAGEHGVEAWGGEWYQGGSPDGDGYMFVRVCPQGGPHKPLETQFQK